MSDAAKLPSTEWLEGYLFSQNVNNNDITDSRCRIILDFTLLWNLFESQLLSKASDRIDPEYKELSIAKQRELLSRLFIVSPDALDKVSSFLKTRYIGGPDCPPQVPLFSLYERDKGKEEQESIRRLLSSPKDEGDVKQACYMIVYRYRNNLFHGNKDLSIIWEETEIFHYACDYLIDCLTNNLD